MARINLYVYAIQTLTIVAVISCDPDDHGTSPGDAAAGCEHAIPEEYLTEAYAYSYDDAELTMSVSASLIEAMPLSKSKPREITPEIARRHLAEMVRLETERLKSLGVDLDEVAHGQELNELDGN